MGANQLGANPVLRSESLMTKIMLGQEKDIIDHVSSANIDISQPIN